MNTFPHKKPERRTWPIPADFGAFVAELRDYLNESLLQHNAHGIADIRIELPQALAVPYAEHRGELVAWLKRNAIPCQGVFISGRPQDGGRQDILVELIFRKTPSRRR